MAKKRNDNFGWRFIDKDPVIGVYQEARRKTGVSMGEIQALGGPTVATQQAWDSGDTKRPQAMCMASAMQIMHYERAFIHVTSGETLFVSGLKVKPRDPNYVRVNAAIPLHRKNTMKAKKRA